MPRIQARAGPRHQHSSSPLIQEGQIHHLLGLDRLGRIHLLLGHDLAFRFTFACRRLRPCLHGPQTTLSFLNAGALPPR